MLKLIIGNKAYSSWSLRGWLAVKQSGLAFEEVVVPLYDVNWAARREQPDLTPSGGRVPALWHDDAVVWDSLAIIEHLNEATGGTLFWPTDPASRLLARSIAAEMHSGFAPLRAKHGMNVRRIFPATPVHDDVEADLKRIMTLWAEARARAVNGDFLFGAFGAADIMYAPVCTRIVTYSLSVPRFAKAYIDAVYAHPWMQDWIAAAQEEEWVIDRFEQR